MPVKILSLDGGGTWALVQARCLQQLFGNDANGHDVLKHFDYVIANSGGSLVLAALCEGKTLQEIVDLFNNEDKLQSVFVKLPWYTHIVGYNVLHLLGIGPKFSAPDKLKGLTALLKQVSEKPMSELPDFIGKPSLKLMVCAFDYDNQREVFFRSQTGSKADTQTIENILSGTPLKTTNTSITQAIHASSNAPLNYFDQPAEFMINDNKVMRRFWDGAVGGYNNPVLSGVVEAFANDVAVEDMCVLSIGTANRLLPVAYGEPGERKSKTGCEFLTHPFLKSTFLKDLPKMTGSILDDPPDAATYIAWQFLREPLAATPTKLFRMNPLIQPVINENNEWDIPPGFTNKEYADLVKLDMAVTDKYDVDLIGKLCDNYFNNTQPNQSIRYNKDLKCLIGHPTFEDVKKGWEACK